MKTNCKIEKAYFVIDHAGILQYQNETQFLQKGIVGMVDDKNTCSIKQLSDMEEVLASTENTAGTFAIIKINHS